MAVIWNASDNGGLTTGDAGLSVVAGTSLKGVRATEGRSKGKFYFELTFTTTGRYTSFGLISLAENRDLTDTNFSLAPAGGIVYPADGKRYSGATAYATGTSATGAVGVTVGIAMDMDNGKWFFHYDGVWQGGGDPITGVNPVRLLTPGVAYYPYLLWYSGNAAFLANFGASAFKYTPPTGYIAFDKGRQYPTISWCSYKRGANITLNGDGRTIDAYNTSSWQSAITNKGQATGKWYFEVDAIKTGASLLTLVGLAQPTDTVDTHIGNDNLGCTWHSSGYYCVGGASNSGFPTFTANDTVGVAFDCDAKSVSWYKNGVLQFTKIYPMSGEVCPAVSFNGSGSGGIVRANFGATAFKYAPPTGYKAIDPNNTTLMLLKDGSSIKTITNGAVVDLGAVTPTEELFNASGFTDPTPLLTSPVTQTVAATSSTLGAGKMWQSTINITSAGVTKIAKKI